MDKKKKVSIIILAYDSERFKKTVWINDVKEIDFVKRNLCDDKSIKAFENLLQYRLSNVDDLIKEIYEREHQSSSIFENGTEKILTISIDEMLAGDKATYIKMDIEESGWRHWKVLKKRLNVKA